MQIIKLHRTGAEHMEEAARAAAEVLREGGTVVYPTDTAYGLGANALDANAIEKVFLLKERSRQKKVSVAVKDMAMACRIAVVSPVAQKFLKRILPGAVTVILPKRQMTSDIRIGDDTVGLRVPETLFHEMLFRHIDFPITVTSANISGDKPAYDIPSLLCQFKGRKLLPDLIIDAGSLKKVLPSTVVDLTGPKLKILREGPVSEAEILKIFAEVNRLRPWNNVTTRSPSGILGTTKQSAADRCVATEYRSNSR